MAKLFVICIGGTGIRVMKSLAMLLAAGVRVNSNEIIPIIIDVDKGNEDLTRTIELLNNYMLIQNSIERPNYEGFFQTKVLNIFGNQGNEFRLNIEDVQGKKFSDYIGTTTMNRPNKRFSQLLFSTSNLELNMKEGFQGNPNLGCIVLNQFQYNYGFQLLAQQYTQGDRIIIISSIHGGTGSAGFPLLLKNLRKPDNNLPNAGIIKDALIAGITVLPYYKLNEGVINSHDFVSKSKAALEYYIDNVNPSLNSLYYIGYEDNTIFYENHPGGQKQKNPAHVVELFSALAVVDFANQDTSNIESRGTRFLEYGTRDFKNSINFTSLGDKTNEIIRKPLTKYFLFFLYQKQRILHSINRQPWSNRGKSKITPDFISANKGFYMNIVGFNERFEEWLVELAQNSPRFTPFVLHTRVTDDLNCLDGIPPLNRSRWKDNYVLYDDLLNECERKIVGLNLEQKFIELFNRSTSSLVEKKYTL